MPLGLFAFLAALAIISGIGVIAQRNPVHCVLAFAVVLTDMGLLFMGLDAVTVGFLQIIVYVGAIMVMFLFVIWLLNIQADANLPLGHLGVKVVGTVGSAALAGELFATFVHAPVVGKIRTTPADFGSVASLARTLFTNYLVAFEVTSILLLTAIVGAIALARRMPGGVGLVVVGRAASNIAGQDEPAAPPTSSTRKIA